MMIRAQLPCRCISGSARYSQRVAAARQRAALGKDASMSFHVLDPRLPRHEFDRLAYAQEIVRVEATALQQVADRLDDSLLRAVELLLRCPGRVCITGTGKSADVGQKIAGTFNSTGTRSYVLDATRAVHGDLGMVHPNDVVLALSHSGESEEVVRLLGPLKQLALAVVALTGNAQSTL